MNTCRTILLMAVGLGLLSGAGAQADDAATCEPANAPSGFEDFVIDARDGGALSNIGPNFKKSARVRIVVKHKNPFVHQYKLDVKSEEVTEEALASFLGLSPLSGVVAALDGEDEADEAEGEGDAEGAGGEGEQPGGLSAFAEDLPPCDPLTAAVHGLAPLDQAITTHYKDLRANLIGLGKSVGPKLKTYNAAKPKLQSEVIECTDLRSAAQGLNLNLTLTDESNRLKKAKRQLAGLAAIAKTQLDAIQKIETDHKDLLETCPADQARLEAHRKLADLAALSQSGFETQVEAVEKSLELLTKVKTDVGKVLATPTAFYTLHKLSRFLVATNVTVKLERKSLSDAKADYVAVGEHKLNFGGGPKFALAAGLAYAELPVMSYERIQGVSLGRGGLPILDADGNEQIVTVVGETETSSSRLTPLLILHGRLASITSEVSFHLSTGLTVSTEDDANIEYLIGPSFGFIDDKLFVTFGFYYGETQRLADSFFVGQALGEEVTEIPVIDENEWEISIGISYKFK